MNQNNQQSKKKVGLAISGGWIRATAAIGVIEVLEENGISIDLVSGCSAGSAVAASYAAGSSEELKERLTKGKKREYWYITVEPTLSKNGVLKGERARKFWKEFVGEKEFSDLDKKLFLTATDLNRMEPVVLDQGNVAQAMQACVGVPGIFVPVKYGDKILADGGNFSLIPSEVLYKNGADYVIAIDVSKDPNVLTKTFAAVRKRIQSQEAMCASMPKICEKDPNMIKLIWRAVNLSSSQIENFYHSSYKYDLLIRPDIAGISRLSIGKVNYLIRKGREAALEMLTSLRNDLKNF